MEEPIKKERELHLFDLSNILSEAIMPFVNYRIDISESARYKIMVRNKTLNDLCVLEVMALLCSRLDEMSFFTWARYNKEWARDIEFEKTIIEFLKRNRIECFDLNKDECE